MSDYGKGCAPQHDRKYLVPNRRLAKINSQRRGKYGLIFLISRVSFQKNFQLFGG